MAKTPGTMPATTGSKKDKTRASGGTAPNPGRLSVPVRRAPQAERTGRKQSRMPGQPKSGDLKHEVGMEQASVEPKQAEPAVRRDRSRGNDRVRDTFSMPAAEYALIDELKTRCRAGGLNVKKSELLRIGLATIAALPRQALIELATPLVLSRGGKIR